MSTVYSTRLDSALAARVEDALKEGGYKARSDFVADAIKEKLNRSIDPMELLTTSVRSMNKRLDALDSAVELSSELLAYFVRAYFMHTPSLPTTFAETAERVAGTRMDEFIKGLREHIESGNPRLHARLMADIVERKDV